MTNTPTITSDNHSLKDWLPVCSLGLAAFIFVTTELMPIGLLPEMAIDLHKTEAFTGLLITIYAWCVAILSLPLVVITQKLDRRKLLFLVFGVFIVAHGFAALANSFITLMLARIMIAMAHGVFWSIASPLAARLAPKGYQAQSLAIVITGTSLAAVLGVPLGTLMGHYLGWRVSFVAIGVVAFAVILVLATFLPALPSTNTNSLKALPSLLRRRSLIIVYILTFLTVTSHFTAFSYLAPLFSNIAGLSSNWTAFLLFVLGVSGILGSVIATKIVDHYPKKSIVCAITLIFCTLLLLLPVLHTPIALVILCVIWGAAIAAIGLVFQTLILTIAHDAPDIATSIYSSMYNVGIGGGAFAGSQVFAQFGVSYVGVTGACFAFTALCITCALRLPRANTTTT